MSLRCEVWAVAELSGQYHTYIGGIKTHRKILSRIERCFIALPAADIFDRHPQVQTTCNTLDKKLPSDHAPISVQLLPISAKPVRNWNIPHWIALEEDYKLQVDELMCEFNDSVERGLISSDRITIAGLRDEYKDILHLAHKLVMEQRWRGAPRTPMVEFFRSLTAFRAWRSGNAKSVCMQCACSLW